MICFCVSEVVLVSDVSCSSCSCECVCVCCGSSPAGLGALGSESDVGFCLFCCCLCMAGLIWWFVLLSIRCVLDCVIVVIKSPMKHCRFVFGSSVSATELMHQR